MLITIIAGARPNFIKISPIIKALDTIKLSNPSISYRLVHTGQHFDKKMSEDFFEQLNIPSPDINLQCGGGTQAEQAGSIMIQFERELLGNTPDIVLVVGDVTSTMSCAITAKKMNITTLHVEAGIRSGDLTMPEEINRIVTDSICDGYFTTSLIANNNLRDLNVPENKIHFVGNTMIDTLLQNIDKIRIPAFLDEFPYKCNFFLLTLHRPSNVDDPEKLKLILEKIIEFSNDTLIIFPVHPRTKKIMQKFDIYADNLILIDPQPYLEFIYLIHNAIGVITDSGGITEEATVLNVPCITMRDTTERPETILYGSNELVGDDFDKLSSCINRIKAGLWKSSSIPVLWDGHAAERIVNILLSEYDFSKV